MELTIDADLARTQWTDEDDLPVTPEQVSHIKAMIEASEQAATGATGAVPSSKTLDFLSKHSILQANSMRYFARVFDEFDSRKEHLLDVDQVRSRR